MKKLSTTVGLLSVFLTLPAQAQFVSYRPNGTPIFLFRNPAANIPSGQEITMTISEEERNIPTGATNACGYRILAPGTNAQSISRVHPSTGAEILVSNLPTFNGECSTSGGSSSLRPENPGDPVPTSHYKTPDGKVAIKTQPDWSYLTVTYTNVTRKSKVGQCGEVRYAPPAAKEGQRALSFSDTVINIPGIAQNVNLLDTMQNNKDGICAKRWRLNSNGSLERVGVFLSN